MRYNSLHFKGLTSKSGKVEMPGMIGLFAAIAREAARAQRHAARQAELQRRTERRRGIEAERLARRSRIEAERILRQTEKDRERGAKQVYLERRLEETDGKNEEISNRLDELKSILQHTLEVDDTISFGSLKIEEEYNSFQIPKNLRQADPPIKENFFKPIIRPNWLMMLFPWVKKRYEKELANAEEQFNNAVIAHEFNEEKKKKEIDKLRFEHENEKESHLLKAKQRNQDVDEFEESYRQGDPDSITSYCTLVLERSDYPENFPQVFRIAYVPESKQVVVEYELPKPDVIPYIEEYRYVKNKDEIAGKPRKVSEIKELYQDIVSSIALRTMHELFEADQGGFIDVIVFNGLVQTVDLSTGQDIRPFLISVRAIKEDFLKIDLSRIDKKACLRNLGAQVSPRANEMMPIKPILEFDMVDRRFIEESDVLSVLDSRPNLMDLNPYEFENLVANLFNNLGYETKLTRSHKDGGVDAIVFDTRPVTGGKLVIQAKRYRHAVGVSAVRDLYGTMVHEWANKGILVTTSGYGPDAFQFCKDKPIELIDGGGLLYLLQQAGIKARIIFPEE
jgi:restriction system protein